MTKKTKKSFLKNIKKTQNNDTTRSIVMIDIGKVKPDSRQIRKVFDQGKLEELADSIREHGIISPLIVRQNGDGFHIIAGERRYRAAKMAGKKEVPCIVEDIDNTKAKSIQIIENLQRHDITPIETAMAFAELLEQGMTQQQICKSVGLSKANVSKYCSIAKLPLAKIAESRPNAGLKELYEITKQDENKRQDSIDVILGDIKEESEGEQKEGSDLDKLWKIIKKDVNRDVNNLSKYITGKKLEKLLNELVSP